MSFTSDCPRCRKQVMVPDGACAEALVRCPVCMAEYSLGEVLAAAPPALIVVSVPAAAAVAEAAIAPLGAGPPPPPTRGSADGLAEAIPFEAVAGGEAHQLADEDVVLHEPAAEDGPWGKGWKEVGEEGDGQAVDAGAVEMAEADDAVDFAAITGSAPTPRSLDAGAAPAPPAPGKRKRRRQTSPVVRVIGIVVAGLLAVPVADILACYISGPKNDFLNIARFLPGLRQNGVQAEKVSNGDDADVPMPEAKTDAPTAKTDSGAVVPTDPGISKTDEASQGDPSIAKPNGQWQAPATEPKSGKTEGLPTKTGTKPDVKTAPSVDPFSDNEDPKPEEKTTPVFPPSKADSELPGEIKVHPVGKPDPSGKTEAKTEQKPEAKTGVKPGPGEDPFGPTPTVEPKTEAKTEAKTGAKTEQKPEAKTGVKPGPGEDPFGPTPTVEPKTEAKTEAKTGAKTEQKPEAKTDTTPGPDEDPFGPTPAIEPKAEVKTEAKTEAKTGQKPDAKTEPPSKTEAKTGASPKVDSKPETPIGPEPKAETKVEPKAAVSLGPVEAPTYETAELDEAIKVAQDAYATDATPDAYEKLRHVAEVMTFVKVDAAKLDAQKQTVQGLVEKIGKLPQGPQKIAGLAKKLLDDAGAKGGVVVSGTVSRVTVKDGMTWLGVTYDAGAKPVLVLSIQPLGVKENDRVWLLGAVVREPAKNLAGYKGSQPMVIWGGLALKAP
jgi:hypothetical protein